MQLFFFSQEKEREGKNVIQSIIIKYHFHDIGKECAFHTENNKYFIIVQSDQETLS